MQLTLLLLSPRVAPGLLTAAAWDEVRSADLVVTSAPATVSGLAAQGVHVELVEDLLSWIAAVPTAGRAVVLVEEDEAAELLAAGIVADGVRSVRASYDVPGARLLDLVRVMDRLRTSCPWDREQTHRSLVRYLLEEAHETIEAIESGDTAHLQEELGDLLLQVVFHARIASERGDEGFDIDDVATGITEKLVYRHPHVFAGLEVADSDEVDRNWETLKAAEKQRSSPLEGIPASLPALAYAEKVVGRLAKAGALPHEQDDSLGDRLLALVNEGRGEGLDPEQELRDAVRRLIERAG